MIYLGLDGRSRDDDFETGSVSKVSLRRLRVIVSSVTDSSAWRSNRKLATVKLISGTISVFCCFVDNLWGCENKGTDNSSYLIKSRENVVSKLNLCDSTGTSDGSSDTKAGDTLDVD